MSRFYFKSGLLIAFTLVLYYITRLISPNLKEADELTRQRQVQKVQGNVRIVGVKRPKHSQQESPVDNQDQTEVDPLHKNLDTSKMSIECESVLRAEEYEKRMNTTKGSPDPKTPQKYFPKALIIGARYSGASALIRFLSSHPEINAIEKEGDFFSKEATYQKGLTEYWNSISSSLPSQITVENTPGYFLEKLAPPRIKCFNPNMKFILILRDPVQRLLSEYVHSNARKLSNLSTIFEELMLDKRSGEISTIYAPVKVSDYHVYLETWLRYFQKGQFLVLDGELFLKNPLITVKKVETFLHIRSHFTGSSFSHDKKSGYFCLANAPKTGNKCMSPDKGLKRLYPKVKKDLLTKLAKFYEPHNEKLFEIIGDRLKWW